MLRARRCVRAGATDLHEQDHGIRPIGFKGFPCVPWDRPFQFFKDLRARLSHPWGRQCVEIVNGTTHGASTYVANVDAAWLAMQPRFCRGFGGDSLQLLVCAVLHTEFVSHHKDAKVASQEGHVVPVGVVTGSRYKDTDSQGRGSRGIPHMVEPILVWDMVSLAATPTADISALPPGGIHKQTYH